MLASRNTRCYTGERRVSLRLQSTAVTTEIMTCMPNMEGAQESKGRTGLVQQTGRTGEGSN